MRKLAILHNLAGDTHRSRIALHHTFSGCAARCGIVLKIWCADLMAYLGMFRMHEIVSKRPITLVTVWSP